MMCEACLSKNIKLYAIMLSVTKNILIAQCHF